MEDSERQFTYNLIERLMHQNNELMAKLVETTRNNNNEQFDKLQQILMMKTITETVERKNNDSDVDNVLIRSRMELGVPEQKRDDLLNKDRAERMRFLPQVSND